MQLDLETLRFVRATYELREVGVDFDDWLSNAIIKETKVKFKSCGCPREIENHIMTNTTVPVVQCSGCGRKIQNK